MKTISRGAAGAGPADPVSLASDGADPAGGLAPVVGATPLTGGAGSAEALSVGTLDVSGLAAAVSCAVSGAGASAAWVEAAEAVAAAAPSYMMRGSSGMMPRMRRR